MIDLVTRSTILFEVTRRDILPLLLEISYLIDLQDSRELYNTCIVLCDTNHV